ncbi:MAG: FkbM family methyltransferase [Patescibacteria group bacterium]
MQLPINGIFFRDFKNAYIPEILKEIYRDKVYDPYLKEKKDLVIMDVGANIGLFTQYAYTYAKSVYSVEPSKDHAEVLNTMIAYNKLDKVIVINAAISNSDGTAKFYHNENVTMYSLKDAVNGKPQEVEDVKTYALDTLFSEYKIDYIDFMKLDVEGSECEIIGSKGFENVREKIGTIVGEYHNWSGYNPHQLEASFRDNGFYFEWLRKTEATLFLAVNTRK